MRAAIKYSHTAMQRFCSRVVLPTDTAGCWEWQGNPVSRYGFFDHQVECGGRASAHRFSYERFVAPIPDGTQIDHLCCNKRCVNPEHLEAVGVATNSARRSETRPRKNHCVRGHELTGRNVTLRQNASGRGFDRFCRACARWHSQQRLAVARVVRPPRRPVTKSHCLHGHSLTGNNVQYDVRGYPKCGECKRLGMRRLKARRRIELNVDAAEMARRAEANKGRTLPPCPYGLEEEA